MVYSTSTVDTAISGTTTLDYWATVPSSQQLLHVTRDVVIEGAANDNAEVVRAEQPAPTPEPANYNSPPLDATGTGATSSAQ